MRAKEWRRRCGGGNHRGRMLQEIEDVEKEMMKELEETRSSWLLFFFFWWGVRMKMNVVEMSFEV
jgi:hypothetical protein